MTDTRASGVPGEAAAAAGLVVVKVGGRVQSDPALPRVIADAWAAAPGTLVVVHGGGDEITALQHALGVAPQFVGGRRVTSPRDIDTLRMALSGAANKRLVASLVALGVPALGLSGEDAALIAARRNAPALGEVGAPSAVNVALVRLLLGGGYLPVLSPLARDADATTERPGALNVNGDDAAAAVAAALGADELLLVADVPGVKADGAVVRSLDPAGARDLIASGVAAGGMAAKLEAALAACAAGVRRVRVGDLHMIADPARGTAVAAHGAATAHHQHQQHQQHQQQHPFAKDDVSLAV